MSIVGEDYARELLEWARSLDERQQTFAEWQRRRAPVASVAGRRRPRVANRGRRPVASRDGQVLAGGGK